MSSEYLGDDPEAHKLYDASEVLRAYKGPKLPLLVDQVRGRWLGSVCCAVQPAG